MEHWANWRRREEKGHMVKHQLLHHEGREPNFTMKVISSHKTALNRQIMEAVRIRRRGGEGEILNSKGEINRAYIPRLVLEQTEEGEEDSTKEEELRITRELDQEQYDWEQQKMKIKKRYRRRREGGSKKDIVPRIMQPWLQEDKEEDSS